MLQKYFHGESLGCMVLPLSSFSILTVKVFFLLALILTLPLKVILFLLIQILDNTFVMIFLSSFLSYN